MGPFVVFQRQSGVLLIPSFQKTEFPGKEQGYSSSEMPTLRSSGRPKVMREVRKFFFEAFEGSGSNVHCVTSVV